MVKNAHALAENRNSLAVTRAWKVYGNDGHRQAVSFQPSVFCDFSSDGHVRIVEVMNSDVTGTNEYSIIRITRDTANLCELELHGQLSDGFFENARTDRQDEITSEDTDLTISDLCRIFNITQTEISRRFDIPLRSVQNWHANTRKPPRYLVYMLVELLKR